MTRIIIGGLIILIGLSALFDFNLLKIVFPLILIFIGIRVITGRNGNWENLGNAEQSEEEYLNEVAIFSPINKKVNSKNFRGGKVVLVFGGGEIDISQCQSNEKEINLEIVAVFGGGKLIVPKGWQVQSEGVAILGGYANNTKTGSEETILRIKGAAIFGGVEIVN